MKRRTIFLVLLISLTAAAGALGLWVSNYDLTSTEAAPDYGTKSTGDTFTAAEHNELYNSVRELFGLVGNATSIQGTPVDNSDQADGRLLKYNGTSGYLEYEEDLSGGGTGDAYGDLLATAPISVSGTTGYDNIIPGDDADYTIAINDAVANGTTKGAATFNPDQFDSLSGLISLDLNNFTSTDFTFDSDTVPTGSVFNGSTSLEETTSATDSGAYIIGVYDEFSNATSTNLQGVLNELDAAISAGGSTNATSIQGVDVNDTNIADGRVFAYNSTGPAIEYVSDLDLDSVTSLEYFTSAADGERVALMPNNTSSPTIGSGETGFTNVDNSLYYFENGGSLIGFDTFWSSGNDGSGSTLDADLLDGVEGAAYARSDQSDTLDGDYDITGELSVDTDTFFVDKTNDWIGVNTDTPLLPADIRMDSGDGNVLSIGNNVGGLYGYLGFKEVGSDAEDYIFIKSPGGTEVIRMYGSGEIYFPGGGLTFTAGTRIEEFSTDGTLSGDSNSVVPTENAIKAYVDANTFSDSAPTTSSDTCTAGTVAYDSSYIYICVATDTWRRTAVSTW
jgi:hypothetical protein